MTKIEDTLKENPTKPPLNMKQRLTCWGLVLLCILLSLLLAAFVAVSAVVLESHTYKRAARNEAYLAGVENAAIDIMKEAAKENGLSKSMLMKHVQRDDIRRLAKRNAAEAALVLKGSQVIYGDSFHAAALETDIYKFFEMRLPEPEVPDDAIQQPAQSSDESVQQIQTQDTAPLLGKTEEDPERAALREIADELAAEISSQIDAAVRVIDMEQVVHDYSDSSFIDWLRFMGRGGVLLPLVLLAVMLLLLHRQVWQRGFSPWLAGISIGSGSALLVCAVMIPALGWLDLSVEPVQLNILYDSVLRGLLTELLVMALLWFAVAYIAVRAAIGKPVSTKWIKALFTRLHPAAENAETADAADSKTPDIPTVSGESPIGDTRTSGNKSAPTNAALLDTIKKAAADSTNSLLGRKRR